MGLNPSFSNIKAQMLLQKPIPTFNDAFSAIQQEEKQREVSFHIVSQEHMAMATCASTPNLSKLPSKYFCTHCKVYGHSLERCFKIHGSKLFCNHYNVSGHSIERCYKIHGYPWS
ncbi:hypothetical protein Ddye_028825 [Dipteronia dyeriana]|uniref:Uncharacterized protein n=1 Tax=Dipteronia dyeriana TaxID=168575 RepID=A0AAD9TE07_9ROSI|nr:hypothetical protein Ddye_028825 [Dipteronia dyeriana]